MVRPKLTRKEAKVLGNVYRGYLPPDLPQDRPRNPIKWWWKVIGKPMLTIYPQPEKEEWTKEPEYPPNNDATPAGLKRQFRLDWYELLKTLPTAEAKLHDINDKSNHRMAHINNFLPTTGSLPFVKYLTQTHLIKSLPTSYIAPSTTSGVDNDEQVKKDLNNSGSRSTPIEIQMKQIVLDQIALAKHESQSREGNYFVTRQIRDYNKRPHLVNRLIEQIFSQARKALTLQENPQLLDYQLDLSPAIRSWWYHSGFEPPNNKLFYRFKKDEDGNVNTMFQMNGSSALNIRGENMIEPIVEQNNPLVTDISLVEKCNYTPKYFGAKYKFKWPVALPGFWFEDTPRFDCPHTCFLSTDCLDVRESDVANFANLIRDEEDCLTSQAILSAFGWLNSLSMYHGYTPFNELHYPFTCQVVTTDGQNWLFNVFQLNSHTFHRDLGGPKKNNICWSSGLMKLYEDYRDGNFIGINDEVIRLLVKFISTQNSPEYTSQLNLRPYLHQDDRTQEQKDKTKKRLRDTFEARQNKWMAEQWAVPEWERIFFRSKVTRHQIRHMKPRWSPPKPRYPKHFE